MQAPSSFLPPIATLSSEPPDVLSVALDHLRVLYNPSVRGSRRRRPLSQHPTPANIKEAHIRALRSDAYERAHAIRWLTALTRCALSSSEEDSEGLLHAASALLAVCAGPAAAGTLTRTFVFSSDNEAERRPDGAWEVSVQLTDRALENSDFESVGTQTWGGACVLAERIVEAPHEFGLPLRGSEGEEVHVLELGAGTGLVSLALAKLFEDGERGKTIVVATDFYPIALMNLKANIRANFSQSCDADTSSPVSISARFLDWSSYTIDDSDADPPHRELPQVGQALPPTFPPLDPDCDGPFDLVLGADIVYDTRHAAWIKNCLHRLLKRVPASAFHLVVPLRAAYAKESRTVEEVFGRATDAEDGDKAGRELELRIRGQERIVCDTLGDEGEGEDSDGVVYAYYIIGWS